MSKLSETVVGTMFSNQFLKFKDLRVYGSAEWLAGKRKKYRRVYDRSEATYIYAEFSAYNKMFDREEWDLELTLKAYALKGNRKIELCSLDVRKTVKKEENIIYVREGWGNKKPGIYWKKGMYQWEVTLGEQVIATSKFHVEDVGVVSSEKNPYFEIQSLRLYESGDDGVQKNDRVYMKKFDCKETRFVFIEFIFKNLVFPEPWNCELIFNFYNDARQLKGETIELKPINSEDETFTLTTGWGSDTKGTWFPDKYTLEIIFMDQLVAVLPYEVGEGFEEGVAEAYLPEKGSAILPKTLEEEKTLIEVMENLEKLVGLETIKKKVREYAEYLKFVKIRIERGIDSSNNIQMHAIFTGNPGTGKTTVAKMLGKIYQKMGLLSSGHVHEVDRSDLVGEYIGQTAPKVKEAIKKARGGILFIDEAYSLARSADDAKDFGREVIEILVKELSDGTGDLSIIFAGYPAEMKTFIDTNAGLKSRLNLHFEFPDYVPQELADIAIYACEERNVQLTVQGKSFLYDKIVEAYRSRDRYFGNARYVNKLIDQAKMNMGLRVMLAGDPHKLSDEEISTITIPDIEMIYDRQKRKSPDIPVEEEMLHEALKELNEMIGLDNVKKDVEQLVKLVRFYKETGREVLSAFSLHTVFIGNPGTGKTTVARIIAKIYKALGILERGHLVECDRQSLVAGFVGQTAMKTTKKIDEAEGGVLFIDEAYALTQRSRGSGGDFGSEAIETLLKRMEDDSGKFAVIVAGYPQPMKLFVESNPGLKSRFDRTFEFKDFSIDELMSIAFAQFEAKGFKLESAASEHLKKYIAVLVESKDKFFGNGRVMRNMVAETIRSQNLRMAGLTAKKRTAKALRTINLQDVEQFNGEKAWAIGDRARVGFKKALSSPSGN